MITSLLWDIVLNATIPAALFFFAKHFISPSEVNALLWATSFPLLTSAYDLRKRRQLDPVALLILLGLVASVIAALFGGDPRLLLIRESFFTGAFGLACLISPALPRPLMFYFGRYFMAGRDTQKRDLFNARWQDPAVRRAHRLVTVIWGLVYVGEFGLRIALAYNLPAPVVLAISPFSTGLVTVGTIVWTFWYAHGVRSRIDASAKRPQL
jgi:hypothetical protein